MIIRFIIGNLPNKRYEKKRFIICIIKCLNSLIYMKRKKLLIYCFKRGTLLHDIFAHYIACFLTCPHLKKLVVKYLLLTELASHSPLFLFPENAGDVGEEFVN